MKTELTLKTLPELDYGKVDVALQRLLRMAVQDCLDRAGDAAVRKVTVSFCLTPLADQSGDCDRVELECHLSNKLPAFRTRPFECAARKNGSLVFDNDSADDIRQMTLGDAATEPPDVAHEDPQ